MDRPSIMFFGWKVEVNNTPDDIKRCLNIGLFSGLGYIGCSANLPGLIGSGVGAREGSGKYYIYFAGNQGASWRNAGYTVEQCDPLDNTQYGLNGLCMSGAEISDYLRHYKKI